MVIRYYKRISNGYLVDVGFASGYEGNLADSTEITEEEYNSLMDIITNVPEAPEGYTYRITSSGEYELAEAAVAEGDSTPSDSEYMEIGHIFLGEE